MSQTIKNRVFGRSWGRLCGVLGCLGQPWRVLSTSGACLECIMECQRASWRRLGLILKRLGAISGRLGRIWEGFGRVLEAFWNHFGSYFRISFLWQKSICTRRETFDIIWKRNRARKFEPRTKTQEPNVSNNEQRKKPENKRQQCWG